MPVSDPSLSVKEISADKNFLTRSPRILVIDDDPEVEGIVGACLQNDRAQLTMACTGTDGLKLAQQQAFDLVLLDLGLPEMDGFAVLQELKASPLLKDIAVIVLTAWNNTGDKVRGFESGAVDYITKPFEVGEFRARVRSTLRNKFLQDQLLEANRQLEAARQAAESATRTKSQFLANMSHEIRTPMSGMISMTGLLFSTELTEEQRSFVEIIRGSGETLLHILNDILDYSKIESGKVELEHQIFDLREAVESSIDLLALKAAEKSLELIFEIAEEVPQRIQGDVTRLRQVLINLLSNAIKFTPVGEVFLRVNLEPSTLRSTTPQLHFAVQDTGIGITEENLERLFKAFSQANATMARKFGGTGLGLSICKSLIELMHGRIWVESKDHQGSTFHFSIPFDLPPADEIGRRPDRPSPLAGKRLLVIEDNSRHRALITARARAFAMTVYDVENEREALNCLKHGEIFDTILLDQQLPGCDGLSVAEEICRVCKGQPPPMILLTPVNVRWETKKLRAAGIQECLTKPIKPAELRAALMGTIFKIKTSLKTAAAALQPDALLAARLPLQLLVVDDDEVNQMVLLRMLKQMGYRADVARNGKEALEAHHRSRFDLLFMDLQMPELDGLEVTQRIRQWEREKVDREVFESAVVIVAVTANALKGDRERCLASGMNDYLCKPVSLVNLQKILERWGALVKSQSATFLQSNETANQTDAGAEEESADRPTSFLSETPPVNMQRLIDFAAGDDASMQQLIAVYLSQTTERIARLRAAVQASAAGEIQQLAHACVGASTASGMTQIVFWFKQLEQEGKGNQLSQARETLARVEKEFERIQQFLRRLPAS